MAVGVGADAGHLDYLWRNGALVPWESATVHVNAVGHASVSAVFEGIKAYRAADCDELYVFRLEDHLRRMLDSAKIARLGVGYSLAQLAAAVVELLQANGAHDDTYVRPWMFPSGLIHEHLVPAGVPTECVIDVWPFRTNLLRERSCRAAVSSWWRIQDNSMPPRLKTFSNYHNGRLGMLEAHANGYDWPIFLNDRGKVTEGPGACLVLVREGRLITPNLSSNLLDSITRRTILDLARIECGLVVEDREVDRTELYVADEMFFVGTGWEILPIVDVDGLQVGDGGMGPVAHRLDSVYSDVLRGRNDRYRDWLTPVWPAGASRPALSAKREEAR
jgi:branched-chain amino acid aminotransferase